MLYFYGVVQIAEGVTLVNLVNLVVLLTRSQN